jgi:hypothetical protein
MDPRDELIADTQRIFAEFADRLTLEEARECQANVVGLLRLLIEWKSGAKGQTLSSASTARMQFRNSDIAISKRARSRASQAHVD